MRPGTKAWKTEVRRAGHPLIAGSVFHYELEFIHPFADGNGRIGRLWQTLILSRWNPLFAYLPRTPAAAGLWGPESTPEEIGWAEAPGTTIKPGMLIARVRGHSMEPKIQDGSWNLFRERPQGSRDGKIVLVQFNSMGDPENGTLP